MINKLLGKWYFPVSLKYFSLLVFVVLIVTGFMASSTDSVFVNQLRNTNLGNLIVWSFWWPAIVILAVVLGRVWCMVCPVEVVTTFFSKIGLKRKRPKWLLSGWAITVFYIFILFVGIQGFSIHRNPWNMSIYLLGIVVVSVVIGSIFEKNAFCRYVCPVGYLLGIYSRLSFFGWRVKDKDVCSACKDKSCIHKNYQYNLNYKSCGVDLYPGNLHDNADCILCAGCMKSCGTYQSQPTDKRPNPQFQYIGFASDLFRLKPLKAAEMVLILVVSGYMISQIWSEWSVTNAWLRSLSVYVNTFFQVENPFLTRVNYGVVWFALVPLLVWSLPWIFSRMAGMNLSFRYYLLNYGIAFIPIVAAAHVAKSIVKAIDRVPYIRHLPSDVSGVSTAQKIIDGDIILRSNPLWADFLVSIVITASMVVGIALSLMVVKGLNQKAPEKGASGANYLIPVLYGGIFMMMLIAWRWF